ncbi:Gti1/Pac2 family-domain-containing protein [Mycena leptocephala]|nr:Gti1/Pac2 family-domain-containing protein [Mycena leptocephala]
MSSSQPTDIPPFYGAVETTMNALRLIRAARQGVIPRITRRLNGAERRTMIKSGAVFVFNVEESGIKRWTDGLLWSPSRIVGNFLVYREINERTNSRGSHKKLYSIEQPSLALSVRPSSLGRLHNALTAVVGIQTSEQETFKPNGLIKKTVTVTIERSDLHLISYYTSADQHSGKLKRPTSRPDIMNLPMDPRLFRGTNFRVSPKIEKAPDGTSWFVSYKFA